MRAAVTLFLTMCYSCSTVSLAFAPASSPQRGYAKPTSNPRPQRLARTTAVAAWANDTSSTADAKQRYNIATQLLGRLFEKRKQDIEPPFKAWLRRDKKSYKQVQEAQSSAIEALIEQLTVPVLDDESRRTSTPKGIFDRFKSQTRPMECFYDPAESLFGSGFYCTLYFYYPNSFSDGSSSRTPPEDPIWEKTSLKASNIKGQQYYIRNDFQQSVINYSEVWGPDVTISAEGILTPMSTRSSVATKNKSRNLRKLPDVFRVNATKISASVFGLSVDFKIEGSADLVVLYADPRLRIFVSPLPSETVVGNWEEAGLVVVQVRGDLVPSENESIPQLVDLR